MTFLNFFRLIHIHPILIIFIFISLFTGTFVQLFIILFIVLLHELGHYFAAAYYKWRVSSIMLWVFGGVLKTEESLMRKIKEDMIVTIAGPCQHIFIFLLIHIVAWMNLLPDQVIHLAHYYNAVIFLFNLLPIYPLDGGKLLFNSLSLFLPFKQAHRMTVVFSILICLLIVLLQLFVFPFTLSAFLLIVFLLMENRTEWKNHYYIFIRFLLNRYHHLPDRLKEEDLIVSEKNQLIEIFSLFKRNRIHHIQVRQTGKKISERESLTYYFKDKKLLEPIGEITQK